MVFETLTGLYLLGFLIPLFILYLIKSKPKNLTIPSLLFFTKQKKTKKYNSLLQKFITRLLFFIQILSILLLALSAANFTVSIPIDAFSLNTVVIVDMSASMNTREGSVLRIDKNKQELLKSVKGRASIILAEENPVILAKNVTASKARSLLTNLKAKDLGTRLDASVILASDLLGEERGNIIIYSDFVLNKDDDLLAAKKLVEADNKKVTFIQTGTPRQNKGFVNLNFHRGKAELFFKNFGERDESVDIRVKANGKSDTNRVDLPSGSVERITFDIQEGESTIEFVSKDFLPTDDKIYIMNPYKGNIRILFITNDESSIFLKALQSNPQFDVQVTVPPVIPDLDHDLVVLGEVDQSLLLPNTFRDIKRYKDSGGYVIITAQDASNSFNYQGLLPLSVGDLVSGERQVCVDLVNAFTTRISNPRCFTSIFKHHSINVDKALVLASTDDNTPVLILGERLLYYGIQDKFSSFKEQITYPLFWDDTINFMLGRESLSNFNFKTGDIFLTGNQTEKRVLDTTGFHTHDGKRVAVNLINRDESDISQDGILVNTTEFESLHTKANLEINLAVYLLLAAFVLFGYELYYIKKRGDL